MQSFIRQVYAVETGNRRLVVLCRDTDVLVLLLHHMNLHDVEMGLLETQQCYPVHTIAAHAVISRYIIDPVWISCMDRL